ncbi:MAG TPA: hypothetical protein VGK67_07580 [Myxococcales bacterium]|jgi:hypothetical protein
MTLNPCQPGPNTSCAVCCGLHVGYPSRAAIAEKLQARFDALSGRPADEFGKAAIALTAQRRTSGVFGEAVAHCTLAGFLDPGGRRVGCLGHRMATRGPDLRDLGSYGALTCEEFQCPAVGAYSDDEIALAREACDDWYLYGLVITDPTFLHACLEQVHKAAPRALVPADLARAPVREALRRMFALKEGARPYGDGPEPGWDLGSLAVAVARALTAAAAP